MLGFGVFSGAVGAGDRAGTGRGQRGQGRRKETYLPSFLASMLPAWPGLAAELGRRHQSEAGPAAWFRLPAVCLLGRSARMVCRFQMINVTPDRCRGGLNVWQTTRPGPPVRQVFSCGGFQGGGYARGFGGRGHLK